jgi:hypothetical protein
MSKSDPTPPHEAELEELQLKFNEVLHHMYNLEILPHIQGLIHERIPKEHGFTVYIMPDDLIAAINAYCYKQVMDLIGTDEHIQHFSFHGRSDIRDELRTELRQAAAERFRIHE